MKKLKLAFFLNCVIIVYFFNKYLQLSLILSYIVTLHIKIQLTLFLNQKINSVQINYLILLHINKLHTAQLSGSV